MGSHGQKWSLSFRSWDSKMCCISRMNWWNELFFACWYKLRRPKSYLNNYLVGMISNGQDLIYHGTFKSVVSFKWFDEFSRSIEWILHPNSNGMIFGLKNSLLCIFDINTEGPLQLFLATFFSLNCSGIFFVLEMFLKKATLWGFFWNCSWIYNK